MSRAKRGSSRHPGRGRRTDRYPEVHRDELEDFLFSPVSVRHPRSVDVVADLYPLQDVTDGRLFDPDPLASTDVSVGYRARLLVPLLKTVVSRGEPARFPELLQVGARLGYAEPKRVAACVRRAQRKQVLHAKGIAGSAVKFFRKRKRGPDSDRSC